MEYYSATRKKEILPFAPTCVKLEGIMLSDINQTEKVPYITYMWNLKSQTHKEWSSSYQGFGVGKMGRCQSKCTDFQL